MSRLGLAPAPWAVLGGWAPDGSPGHKVRSGAPAQAPHPQASRQVAPHPLVAGVLSGHPRPRLQVVGSSPSPSPCFSGHRLNLRDLAAVEKQHFPNCISVAACFPKPQAGWAAGGTSRWGTHGRGWDCVLSLFCPFLTENPFQWHNPERPSTPIS